jgi:TonB-linked SusC/RagA family outer membrane protein
MKQLLRLRLVCYASLFLIFFGFAINVMHAQVMVRGTVTAAGDNETLPGVNIVLKNTTRGTTTDLDGRYQLEAANREQILVFSYTGYETQEIVIGSRDVIDVALKESAELLDEFVVIGYGVVRKSDLTGAVSSIKAEEIQKITSNNPVQALQGKASGVQVTTSSGAPGAGIIVRVRGVGTFNNSSPIYVVDGVILDDISFLNSGDIQSMEVLKDASATAIYGSRGANGVILITTQQGSSLPGKPIVSFSTEFGIQRLERKIDLLNGREFAIISNEIRSGTFNNVDALPNTDWQDLIFRTAPVQNHQLTIAGGTPTTSYYVGIGLFNQEGIVPNSNYQRLSVRLNNTYNIFKNVSFGNNLTIAPYKQRNAPNVTYQAYRAQPQLEPYYPDGSFGVVYNVGNPLADLEYSNSYNKGVRAVGNVFADLRFMKDFVFRSSFGLDAAYNKATSFTPAYTVYNPDGTASQQDNRFSNLFKGNSESLTWLWENTVTYIKEFNRHSINAVGGYTMQSSRSEFFSLPGQNIIRDDPEFWYFLPPYLLDEANGINMLPNINNGVDVNLFYSMISYLARVNYSYDNRYIFTATFRRDGSSKFSKDNRYGNFPSLAAGWNLAHEDFMRNLSLISLLKLRASWGVIGNEKISYYERYDLVNPNLFAVFSNPDAAYPAATYGKPGNPNLVWETTTQTDIGLEIGVLNNKLIAEVDYYRRVTDDILVLLATPGHMGNGQGVRITYNAASVLNRGVEFNLRWRETVRDFSYSIGFIGTTIHNEVLTVGGQTGVDSLLVGGFLPNGQSVTLSRAGLPIGAFYGYVTDGIFQNTAELGAYPRLSLAGVGDLRFVDMDNNGRIDGSDRAYIGSPIPKFIFGFNFEFAYKDIDLSLDIQGQSGNKIFNGKDVVRPDPYNFESYVFDRWTGEGTSNTVPRPSFGGYNFTPSDFFIQDGSFVRLRNIMIGYTLPQRISDRLSFTKVRAYIKGTNIYTLTKFTGYTPEIGGFDVLSNGIDMGVYPIPAMYSVGLNITF